MKTFRKLMGLLSEALRGKEQDYTVLSIRKAIALLAIPMILEMFMESLFAIVDVFFVAQIGTVAVATVGLTESVMTLIYALAIGLSMGTGALVARRIGEKRPEEAGEVTVQSIAIGLTLSVALSIIGYFGATSILELMGGSEELVSSGKLYAQIIFLGNFGVLFLFLLNGAFRGAGNASLAMQSLWLANGLNIILDPIFIFGLGPIPALGLEGAAIATTTGRTIGVLFQFFSLAVGKSALVFLKKHFVVNLKKMVGLIKISLGGIGQFLIESASWIFLVKIVALFGDDTLAAYTFAVRIIIFTILPAWGLSNASSTLVGQNLGAGKPDRAERSVFECGKFVTIFLFVVAVVMAAFGKDVLMFFTTEMEVVETSFQGLLIIALGYLFFGYGMVFSQAFNGAGDTKTPLLVNVICFWIIKIPLAYLLAVPMELGLNGVFAAVSICYTLHAFIFLVLFKRGGWKRVSI